MPGDRPHRRLFKRNAAGVLSVALALSIILIGCPKHPPQKKLPPRAKVPQKETMEVQRPAGAAVTPARQASEKLVSDGKASLAGKDYERAASSFRDAINVDATNGAAYYYLAVAQSRLGDSDAALGLLDKAEALLGDDEAWMGRIDELRAELGSKGSEEIIKSPIDQAF